MDSKRADSDGDNPIQEASDQDTLFEMGILGSCFAVGGLLLLMVALLAPRLSPLLVLGLGAVLLIAAGVLGVVAGERLWRRRNPFGR